MLDQADFRLEIGEFLGVLRHRGEAVLRIAQDRFDEGRIQFRFFDGGVEFGRFRRIGGDPGIGVVEGGDEGGDGLGIGADETFGRIDDVESVRSARMS